MSSSGRLGGAERSLLDLMASFRGADPASELCLLAGDEGPLLHEAGDLGVRVRELPLPGSIRQAGDSALKYGNRLPAAMALAGRALPAGMAAAAHARRLRRLLSELRPDLIHTNDNKSHLLAAVSRPAGIPLVWHLRDFLGSRRVMGRALHWTSQRAAGAIAISHAVADDARRVLGELPIVVVHNAIDVDLFRPGAEDGRYLDALAGQPPPDRSTVRVGLVATYARWKGHDLFLEAVARLPASGTGPAVRFYVVGGAIYNTKGSQFTEAELRMQAARLGVQERVAFIGFQEETARVYRSLDVVVHASTEPEPFGRTIVEAMACGRAVIAARSGGAAELFTHDHDAIGFERGDAGALASAIAALAGDPDRRRRLGEAARRTASERFSRRRLSREVAAAYSRFGGNRSAPSKSDDEAPQRRADP